MRQKVTVSAPLGVHVHEIDSSAHPGLGEGEALGDRLRDGETLGEADGEGE